jgi:acyl-CoA reductase-like NAD-dependent aldehyde dehydrogenase
LKAPGSQRSKLLWNLAEIMEKHKEELAAIEVLDNGRIKFVLYDFWMNQDDITVIQAKLLIGHFQRM